MIAVTRTRIPVPLLPSWLRVLGVVGIAGTIFYFSVVTVPPSPGRPGPFWDKYLHFASYAALALALAYSTVRFRDRPYFRGLMVIGLAVAYGILIEVMQGVLQYRTFGLGDMLANVVGAVLVSVWFVFERWVRYRRLAGLPSESEPLDW